VMVRSSELPVSTMEGEFSTEEPIWLTDSWLSTPNHLELSRVS